MKINMKFFLLKSINIKIKKMKYSDIGFKFNNHICDFQKAKKIFKKAIEELKKIKEKTPNSFKNELENKKHWKCIAENQGAEKTLKILMQMGFSRDFVINKIFKGNVSEYKGYENEVPKVLLHLKSYIAKISISIDVQNKERLICYVFEKTIYPLFIDYNHHLYTKNHIKICSNEKLESLLNDYFFKTKFI